MPRKVHTGPNGGKYHVKFGKKVYLRFGEPTLIKGVGQVFPGVDCQAYRDSIDHEYFQDPVITSDGNTYSRAGIERWLQTHGTSPITNLPLANRTLIRNIQLNSIMDSVKRNCRTQEEEHALRVAVWRAERAPHTPPRRAQPPMDPPPGPMETRVQVRRDDLEQRYRNLGEFVAAGPRGGFRNEAHRLQWEAFQRRIQERREQNFGKRYFL